MATSDRDTPTPPGNPMRQDTPDGDTQPGGPGSPAQSGTPRQVDDPETSTSPGQPSTEPHVLPSSTPDGPQTIPAPGNPAGDPVPDQEDNAESSEGEPSDASGGE